MSRTPSFTRVVEVGTGGAPVRSAGQQDAGPRVPTKIESAPAPGHCPVRDDRLCGRPPKIT
jgi:hypothetical protein